MAVYQTSTLEAFLSKSVAQPRFQTVLLTCFAGMALLLAAIGLYGLLSYVVVQRARKRLGCEWPWVHKGQKCCA